MKKATNRRGSCNVTLGLIGAVKDRSSRRPEQGTITDRIDVNEMHLDGGQGPALPEHGEVVELLRRRARETSTSLRWNRNVLLLTCGVLAATMLLAVNVGSTLVAAIIAVPGLAIIWVYSNVQGKRLERQTFEDDVRAYSRLLSRQLPAEKPPTISLSKSPLSERELEVLQQIASGSSNKAAAVALSISYQTVKNHLAHIFEKLGVSDRTSAVLIAQRNGWIVTEGTGRKAAVVT